MHFEQKNNSGVFGAYFLNFQAWRSEFGGSFLHGLAPPLPRSQFMRYSCLRFTLSAPFFSRFWTPVSTAPIWLAMQCQKGFRKVCCRHSPFKPQKWPKYLFSGLKSKCPELFFGNFLPLAEVDREDHKEHLPKLKLPKTNCFRHPSRYPPTGKLYILYYPGILYVSAYLYIFENCWPHWIQYVRASVRILICTGWS